MVHDKDDVHFFEEVDSIPTCGLEWSLPPDKDNCGNSCHYKREELHNKCSGEQDQACWDQDASVVEEDGVV